MSCPTIRELDLLSPLKAGLMLSVPPERVVRMAIRGWLPAVRIGDRLLFERPALRQFMREHADVLRRGRGRLPTATRQKLAGLSGRMS